MTKRKRQGKQGPDTPKRARVDGNDADSPVAKAPSETDILLSNRSLFASDLSRADHDRERRLYKLLGSYDAEDRIRAGEVIILALLGKQEDSEGVDATTEGETTGPVPEAVLLRHLERRLLRGLATSNEASRIGFSYVLSELLGRLFGRRTSDGDSNSASKNAARYASIYPNVTFDHIIELLLEKTKVSTNVPGQEQRDHHWGRLFGLMSFVESGILFGPGDEGRVRRWDTVLQNLLQLGHKIVWLRQYACYVVAQAILRNQLPDKETVSATLRTIAGDNGSGSSLAKTPEGLGIWLAALTRFPDMPLPAPWTAPLAPGSYKDVVAVLRSGGSSEGQDEDGKPIKQSNATPQLPFVWDLLLNELLSTSSKRFDAFWTAVVDQVYFAKGATDHQKLTGFKIFQKALSLCAAAANKADAEGGSTAVIPPSLFSNNLMVCLMNQASNPTPRLHRAAVSVLRDIEALVEENPRVLVPVLSGLLGSVPQSHGVYDFDERVKGTGDGTRPVENILRHANSDNVEEVMRLLRTGALQAKDPKNDQRPIRIYSEYLFRLASRPASGDTETGQVSASSVAFQALAELAYRPKESGSDKDKDSKKKNKKKAAVPFPQLNDKTQTASRKHLLSAAGAILRRPDDRAALCRTVYAIEPESVGVAMTGEIQTNVVDARRQLKQLLSTFDTAAKSEVKGKKAATGNDMASRATQGLAVLLSVSLLQLYHEPRADAIEVLHDIKACGDKLASGSSTSSTTVTADNSENDEDSDEDSEEEKEPDIGQVLTDVLLSLLAETSQLTRQTSLLVFEAFSPFMSAEALDNLADVLSAEENTSGYRALFNQEGEDEDDDDDDDLEMMEMDGEGADEDDDEDASEEDDSKDGSDEESSESESSDSDEEEDEEEDDKKETQPSKETKKAPAKNGTVAVDDDGLEAAIMKTFQPTLGAKKGDKDGDKDGNDDDDDDSDNESDMSDDAMLALDNQLAGHLALLRDKVDGHKKEREEARTRVIQFKHRVLDLLEVYVRGSTDDNSVLLFRLFLPLAALVRDTKDRSLAQKATRIVQKMKQQLKRRRSQTQAEELVPSTIDAGLAILTSLHEAANDRTENRAFAAAVSAASLAIASTLLWMASGGQSAGDSSKEGSTRHAVYLRVAEVYASTKENCEKNGWNVRKSLFTDYQNWCQIMASSSGGAEAQ